MAKGGNLDSPVPPLSVYDPFKVVVLAVKPAGPGPYAVPNLKHYHAKIMVELAGEDENYYYASPVVLRAHNGARFGHIPYPKAFWTAE